MQDAGVTHPWEPIVGREIDIPLLQRLLYHEERHGNTIAFQHGESPRCSFRHILVERAPQFLFLVGHEIELILRNAPSLRLILLQEFLRGNSDETSLRLSGEEFQIVRFRLKGVDIVEMLRRALHVEHAMAEDRIDLTAGTDNHQTCRHKMCTVLRRGC